MKELYLKLRTDQPDPKQIIKDYICLPAGTELIYSDNPISSPGWREMRELIEKVKNIAIKNNQFVCEDETNCKVMINQDIFFEALNELLPSLPGTDKG
jgi:hypothetical protein